MTNPDTTDKQVKAYEDINFLKHDACRPVRLQLEYLKPDVVMSEKGVDATIVIMGSARIPSPETAREELEKAEEKSEDFPDSPALKYHVAKARRMVEQSKYYEVARAFAALASQHSEKNHQGVAFIVSTGGGGGIMEAGNRGAADAGSESVGLNITLPQEQHPNEYISDGLCFTFHYFSMRKMHFLLRAKALCAFPGGFGTMDEVFETLTLIQTGKIQPIPVVLFGREFWEEVINWQAFIDRGLINPEDVEVFRFCETAEEGWSYIQSFWDTMDNDVKAI